MTDGSDREGPPESAGRPDPTSPHELAQPPAESAPESAAPPPPSNEPARRRPARPLLALEGRAARDTYAAAWLLVLIGIALIGAVLIAGAPSTLGRALAIEAGLAAFAFGLMAGARSQGLQRRADAVASYTGPSPFLVYAAWIACLLALVGPLVLVEERFGIATSAMGTLLELSFYLLLYVGLVDLLVVATGGLTWSEILRPKRFHWDRPEPEDGQPVLVHGSVAPGWEGGRRRPDLLGDVLAGIALVVPMILITGWLSEIVLTVLHLTGNEIPESIPSAVSAIDRIAALLAIAVITPIGEEIFFRGFTTNAWARTMSFRRAIWQAGLYFAFIHVVTVSQADRSVALQAAAFAFVARIPVALALGWLYLKRRSILASITLHAGFNGTLLLISWYAATAR